MSENDTVRCDKDVVFICDMDGCIYDVDGCILLNRIQPSVQLLVVFRTLNKLRTHRTYSTEHTIQNMIVWIAFYSANPVEILHWLYFRDNVKVSLFYTTLNTTL